MNKDLEGRVCVVTGAALMAHYSAAKGAVISLTHDLAFELAFV